MDLHAVLVKLLHGAIVGAIPAVVVDLQTVYAWSTQDTKTFWQMFDWHVAVKKLVAGVLSGEAAVFGFALTGTII